MTDDLEIHLYGSQILRSRCRRVEAFDDELRRLHDGMVQAMLREDGIGLAAPQVGRDLRMLIARDDRGPMPAIRAFVNPEFLFLSQERDSFGEGCLSLPGITADVLRPVRVKLRYQDLEGREQEVEDDGLLARILQHEADHLEGVLFVDHLPLIKRKLLAKKLKALSRRAAAG
jgi:peptide deformylase